MPVELTEQLAAVKSMAHWESARIRNVEHEIRTGQRGPSLTIDQVELGGWKTRLAGLEATIGTLEGLIAAGAPPLVPTHR